MPWFALRLLPPNVMRLLASLEHYVALSGPAELRLHQYVSGTYAAELAAGPVGVEVATDYPWQAERGDHRRPRRSRTEWTLTVRVPHWAVDATCEVNGEPVDVVARGRLVAVTRRWQRGRSAHPHRAGRCPG